MPFRLVGVKSNKLRLEFFFADMTPLNMNIYDEMDLLATPGSQVTMPFVAASTVYAEGRPSPPTSALVRVFGGGPRSITWHIQRYSSDIAHKGRL